MKALLKRAGFGILQRLPNRVRPARLYHRLYMAELYCTDMVRYRVELAREMGVKLGEGCRLYSLNIHSEPFLIEMGKNVIVSGDVKFLTHDGGVGTLRNEIENLAGAGSYGRIKIGDNCFIGLGAIILPDVQIGSNCIVAAGAVVFDSFPDDCVIMGNPARVAFSHDIYRQMKMNSPLTVVDPGYPFPKHYPRDLLLEGIGSIPIRKPRERSSAVKRGKRPASEEADAPYG